MKNLASRQHDFISLKVTDLDDMKACCRKAF